MKKIFTGFAVTLFAIAFSFSVYSQEESYEKKWEGIAHNNLLILSKAKTVGYIPSLGVQYNHHYLFSPGFQVGIGIFNYTTNWIISEVFVKTKFSKEDKFYLKNGFWNFFLLSKPIIKNEKRSGTIPKITIGVDLPQYTFIEMAFNMDFYHFTQGNFSIGTGVHF